jgi:hypothetical protein
MAEPVSITAGVATLLSVVVKVGYELEHFRGEVSTIGSDILMLIEDVGVLQNVLESMKATFSKPELVETLSLTGHIGSHWQNILRSLQDAETTLTGLLVILKDANKTTIFLDRPRKALRFRVVAERVQRFTGQVSSCKATLQLSLQTMAL